MLESDRNRYDAPANTSANPNPAGEDTAPAQAANGAAKKGTMEQATLKTADARQDRVLQADPAGVRVPRRFTQEGVDPMSEEAGITWELRTASINGAGGEVLFEQKNVEVPSTWSQTATNIVVNKYFRGQMGTPERETSVRQLISRVSDTLTAWGRRRRYFASEADALAFHDELTHLLVTQKAAFNSPVWFNVGVEERPQCSACFINSVDDEMESILGLAKTEGMLFKHGSGTGTNLSPIRGSKELLAGGGTASGPVSFMKGFDSFAGVIKSGGKTRRAAKMVILDVEHPDIEEFIECKRHEEEKAWALIEAGYDGGFNVPGGAYDSVFFQNANHSVRVTDTFMKALDAGTTFSTKSRRDGSTVEDLEAEAVWKKIAEAAWICGDPGLQFDTTINDWHTCKETDRINASNPCSEYMFLDDSACNLASLNLMKFVDAESGEFDTEAFRHSVNVLILGQEIIVDDSSYPTERIAKNSHAYRPLGLGYANLGALLMANGLPYDSEDGRAVAAAITALMGGEAYAASAEIARAKGAFAGYKKNANSFLEVMGKHRTAAYDIDQGLMPDRFANVLTEARRSWDTVVEEGADHGFRNAQVTVLAPTGTIGFMMDCDTTGIEPDIALVKYKKLVGGGLMKIINHTVPPALSALGYSDAERDAIEKYIDENETIEGAPALKPEHLPVFDCAFKAMNGERSIEPMGHVRMMAATQPFLSGAISKTVNMPEASTVEDIANIYQESWRLGLKAVAIYRDGCKRSQPLSTGKESNVAKTDDAIGPALPVAGYQPLSLEQLMDAAQDISKRSGERELEQLGRRLGFVTRRRLPDERQALTHKFSIAGHEGYITVGLFEDGQPGELFCTMSKEGSTISGLMDCFATAISLALQYGVPLNVLVDKFSHTRFEPSGFTGNKHVPIAKSVADYVFRWLGLKFLPEGERPFDPSAAQAEMFKEGDIKTAPDAEQATDIVQGTATPAVAAKATYAKVTAKENAEKAVFQNQADSPPCQTCGTIMVRNAACYRCPNCGSSSGCS